MRESVLVVREFDKFSEMLARANFEVVNFPAIRTLPVEDPGELDEQLAQIENYDGLFLTSPKAAEIFLEKWRAKNFKFSGKVYVLGQRTKTLFENTNFDVVFRASANTAEDLINSSASAEFAGKRFLFLRGDKSLRTISALLKNIAEIEETIVYRTIENLAEKSVTDEIEARLRGGQIGWICFFSPSGVESFIKAFGAHVPNDVKIAAIGETTAKSAAAKNLDVAFISPLANSKDFALGLIRRIKEID
jgi:uroporphyrinogen-III synthase